MKSTFIFSLLIFLLASSRMGLPLRPTEAGAQEEVTREDTRKKPEDLTILRDPFLDPEWLRKKREEEAGERAAERRKREAERKKQALKLKGIVQVGQRFVAIIDGKALRAGEVIRGRKILEVSRSGIKVLYKRRVRNIFWEYKSTRRSR